MRDRLAETLLAKVLRWDTQQVATERPLLQALAAYKYDTYQQFSPGMRFIESLAVWLEQFESVRERRIAYDFIMSRLIFVSNSEMNHYVSIAYPDYIRPVLMQRTAQKLGCKPWFVGQISRSQEFRKMERSTLFLGLSDGARTDVFRRANSHLSNEQIRLTHELSRSRIKSLHQDLANDLAEICGRNVSGSECCFGTIVLLDDFSGSGVSYLREEEGQKTGKIKKFLDQLSLPEFAEMTTSPLEIIVVLYVATTTAKDYIREQLTTLADSRFDTSLIVVQEVPRSSCLTEGQNSELDELLESYYDSDNETDSTRKGGTDLRYGFAASGLALVLSHNTPNNTIGLIWAKGSKMRPLFARVSRFSS